MKKWPILLISSLALASCGGEGESTDYVEEGPDEENFNEEGFPIVNDSIELTLFSERHALNGPFDEMLVWEEYEEMTNIEINWNDVSQEGFGERKQLEFTSSDLPDVFYRAHLSRSEIVEYGMEANVFIPLEDLIEEYAPNVHQWFEENPEIRDSVTTPDGHIYALPGGSELDATRNEKLWINQPWLDEVGLDYPETQDELVEVLTAFRDEDPGDGGAPLLFRDPGQLIGFMAASYGLDFQMGYDINIEDDTVHIWRTDDRARDYFEFMNMLYEEGLMDRGVFSQEGADFAANINAANVGIFRNMATDAFADVKDQYVGIAPIEGPYGDRRQWQGPPSGFGNFAITTNNPYPAESLRWVDYFYSEEGGMLLKYGIEGETFEFDDEGNAEYIDGTEATQIGRWTPWPGGGIPYLTTEANSAATFQEEDKLAQEALEPFLVEEVYPEPIFNEEQSREVSELRQDIDSYWSENIAQFVTGDRSLDEWDDYVATMEQMGIERLEEIYQEAYDEVYR